jgi:hypothetical protein
MPNLGLSELLIVAIISLPLLAIGIAPIVVLVLLWQRQSRLLARVERLERAAGQPPPGP